MKYKLFIHFKWSTRENLVQIECRIAPIKHSTESWRCLSKETGFLGYKGRTAELSTSPSWRGQINIAQS